MTRRVHRYAGRDWPDPRNTRAWRRLAEQVAAEERTCWLRLPGCTRLSQTADHVIPVTARPDLAMTRSNLRGACHHCNNQRKNTPIDQLERAHQRPAALSIFD